MINNLIHKDNVYVKKNIIKIVNNVIYVRFISQIVVNVHRMVICVLYVIKIKIEINDQMIKVNVIVLIFTIKTKKYAHYVINIKNVSHVQIHRHVICVMIKTIG